MSFQLLADDNNSNGTENRFFQAIGSAIFYVSIFQSTIASHTNSVKPIFGILEKHVVFGRRKAPRRRGYLGALRAKRETRQQMR